MTDIQSAIVKIADANETYVPLLPMLLKLKGKAYTIIDHFVMEPLFRKLLPETITLKCGRQVSKSTTNAAQNIILSATIPFFQTLFINPQHDQTKRFSSNYVGDFLQRSPISRLMVAKGTRQAVMQRNFINGSIQHFSYCLLDVDRVRGISADKVYIDEVQDIIWDFIPVILECMSHSEYGFTHYTGTPKGPENSIQILWDRSSQAEWLTKCGGCGSWNIPSKQFHADSMIKPWGLGCFKCDKQIQPRNGRWVHAYPDRRWIHAGYHIPQTIMPLHYENPDKWATLWEFKHTEPEYKFMNEKLGESSDVGSKLLTEAELKAACSLDYNNTLEEAEVKSKHYSFTIMGVDWGGGGMRMKGTKKGGMVIGTSFTAVAVLGCRPDGKMDMLYGARFAASTQYEQEVVRIMDIYKRLGCNCIAHDYAVAGSLREVLLLQRGMPKTNITPFVYVPRQTEIMALKSAPSSEFNSYYGIDKARSLLMACAAVRFKYVRFPKWNSCRLILADFLSLFEERVEQARGGDVVHVTRNPNVPDDFAHAINFAIFGYWVRRGEFPDFAKSIAISVPAAGE